MPYISYKRRGNRFYAQLQHSYRDPVTKKVRTKHLKSLGPVGTANAGSHLVVKLLTDKNFRDQYLKSFPELMADKDRRDALRAAEENAPVFIGDLKVGEFSQAVFDGEAMSQKDSTLSAVMQSSSESEQFSGQETASDPGESNPVSQDSQ